MVGLLLVAVGIFQAFAACIGFGAASGVVLLFVGHSSVNALLNAYFGEIDQRSRVIESASQSS